MQIKRLFSRLKTMSTTIRVSGPTRDRFARLAQETGRPMSQLVDEAADALERRVFFDQLATGYEALRADSDAWRAIEAERAAESGALADSSS
jgi:predicted transcriptional regulator